VSLTFERWPHIRGIARGCYDDPDAVTVSSHIWIRSAQSGTALPEGVECFSRARIGLDGQAEPSVTHASPVMAHSYRKSEQLLRLRKKRAASDIEVKGGTAKEHFMSDQPLPEDLALWQRRGLPGPTNGAGR
jgi:hypothetical protein